MRRRLLLGLARHAGGTRGQRGGGGARCGRTRDGGGRSGRPHPDGRGLLRGGSLVLRPVAVAPGQARVHALPLSPRPARAALSAPGR
ncbi:hypothetical protein DWB68_08340 [Galactobacter valiniphilus]|uniref:Uncharacterized protein n=1 Tax=Galactobacter valiniphilus TaxID=2676122 RepID=A0A399JD97_9MICC|nr:hypothetical protein DWB68_08340 [Galactobacter valiniphilus]